MNTAASILFATDQPVAAVRLEGTLAESDAHGSLVGEPIPDAIAALALLREQGHYVVVVSPLTHTSDGLYIAFDWLVRNGVEYDELWASPGIPPADQWYDNEALTL